MKYLLDTNACVNYLNAAHGPVAVRIASLLRSEVGLCSIVKMELFYGAERSARRADNFALLSRFFAEFSSLPFDDAAALHAGRIRAELAAAGTPIGPNDLLIAAIALANDLVLVTHNTREFGRVVRLRYEDWEAS